MYMVTTLLVVNGLMFAFSLGAWIRKELINAGKHGNGTLLFLHLFWIVLIVSFTSNVPLWLYGGL